MERKIRNTKIRTQRLAEIELSRAYLQKCLAESPSAIATNKLTFALADLNRPPRGGRGSFISLEKRLIYKKNAKQANDESRKTALSSRCRWSSAHDDVVLSSDMEDKEIANMIGRSKKAVEVRRRRLVAPNVSSTLKPLPITDLCRTK